MDPLSITLVALSAKAGEAILTGIIGNRSDFLLVNSFQKIKQIVTSRNNEFPENHDLLRTLRKSMLSATDMIRLSMKEDGEQKEFRKKLKSWIDEQIKLLPSLENWADWNNPASDQLELFFEHENKYSEKKLVLTQAMTNSWQAYLETQLQIELPNEFREKLINGWQEKDILIRWDDAVMVLMIEALRDGTNEMGQRASKAFEHNFLSAIKVELDNVKGTTASIEMQLSTVYEKMLSQFDNIDEINHFSNTINSQQTTIESQQLTIIKLVEANEQIRDEKAKELSKDPDKITIDETELLIHAYINQRSIYTDMEPGYELLCVRCGGAYFGYEYTEDYIAETNDPNRDMWTDNPKQNPRNARVIRLHWLAVLDSLIIKEFVSLQREKSYNKFYELTVKGKLYADAVIQYRSTHDPSNIPKPVTFPFF
jgi:hypothetical protein